MEKSESIKNLAMAMSKAQGEMGGAVKAKNNPFFKSKYADLSAVIQAVKEPFANNGLSYVQFPINDNEKIGVETILMHSSGEFLSTSYTVKANKQDAQGAGSVITYCRRYALQSIAGIPSEDDDGNAASSKKTKDYTVNQFNSEKESITAAIRDGMMPAAVIKTLEDQGFTISEAIRLEIESI